MTLTLDPASSVLLLVDLQARLMPAIADAGVVLSNVLRLARTAELLGVPVVATEQNPTGLGPTVPELTPFVGTTVTKRHFGATREPALGRVLQGLRPQLVIAGCEAHVCVLQMVLGLREENRAVAVVADAVGSRVGENRQLALQRADRAGALIVSTEMVLFEWIATCDHPRFKDVLALVR